MARGERTGLALTFTERTLRFARPLETAFGTLRERRILELELRDIDGSAGRGEASTLPPYDGVDLAAVRAALEACGAVLAEQPPPAAWGAGERSPTGRPAPPTGASPSPAAEIARLLDACWRATALPQAIAGIDLALWDLAGRRAGLPVARLLVAEPAQEIVVNATIDATDRQGAADAAAAARAAGLRCVKVKVGVGDDSGRLAAVRAALGADVAIRVDPNGAWTLSEALAALTVLAPVGIELAEEPVHGVEPLARLRALLAAQPETAAIELAMDETAGDLDAIVSGACQAVCLKISRCGGITRALTAADAARAAGSDVYVASTFDGPLGIAAGLHLAAALAPRRACGLATLSAFAGLEDPFPARDGAIRVPTAPGLLG